MIDNKRSFSADEILKQPSVLDLIQSSYILVQDTSVNSTYNKLLNVMELLRNGGRWKLISVAGPADYTLIAVFERIG